MYIDEPDVNFGLVRFGNTASSQLTLHNDSQMPASYEIREKLPANCSQVSIIYIVLLCVTRFVPES